MRSVAGLADPTPTVSGARTTAPPDRLRGFLRRVRPVAFAVAVAVAGCGDDSNPAPADAAAPAPDAAEAIPDAAACSPMIIDSTPADGATGVDAATLTAVLLQFDGDVVLVPGTLELRADGTPVPSTVMLESDNSTVTITPNAGFVADTAYSVVGPCNSIGFATAP